MLVEYNLIEKHGAVGRSWCVRRWTGKYSKNTILDQMEAAFDSNPSSYEIKSELSNCCFGIGVVYLAKHVPSQQFVAVKKFQMDKAKEESNLIRVRFGDKFSLSECGMICNALFCRRKYWRCVNLIVTMCCHCIQLLSRTPMCTWYHRLCVTILAAMRWIAILPQVSPWPKQ